MLKVLADRSDRAGILHICPFPTQPNLSYIIQKSSDIKSNESEFISHLTWWTEIFIKKFQFLNLGWFVAISGQYGGQLMDNPASGLDLRGTTLWLGNTHE